MKHLLTLAVCLAMTAAVRGDADSDARAALALAGMKPADLAPGDRATFNAADVKLVRAIVDSAIEAHAAAKAPATASCPVNAACPNGTCAVNGACGMAGCACALPSSGGQMHRFTNADGSWGQWTPMATEVTPTVYYGGYDSYGGGCANGSCGASFGGPMMSAGGCANGSCGSSGGRGLFRRR